MLAPLSPREREVIGLVDVLGVEVKVAAEILGLSGVALRVARHRGLRRLRALPAATAPLLAGLSTGA